MKLSVPFNGDFEGLKEIVEKADSSVYEVFTGGSPYYIGSIRAHLDPERHFEEIDEQTKFVHDHGIEMSIVLNSTCTGGQHLTGEGDRIYRWYFRELEKAGVDSVVVSDPYFVELLSSDFQIKPIVSTFAYVNHPQKAVFYEELGASMITVDTNVNRDFNLLKEMKNAVSCDLKLIVNENCIYRCPFRDAHSNFCSHSNNPNPPISPMGDYYQDRCLSMRIRNPELLLTSGWIRPEDVEVYEEIGFEFFKIGGRGQPLSWIINCMEAYMKRSYDGNLMDLMDVTRLIKDVFYIPNGELNGIIKKWKECKKDCYRCDFCRELAKRVVRVYYGMGTRMEEIKPLEEM
ncbi:MAG: U32 family peptidase [Candidatus Syntropharchaeia archaeon]